MQCFVSSSFMPRAPAPSSPAGTFNFSDLTSPHLFLSLYIIFYTFFRPQILYYIMTLLFSPSPSPSRPTILTADGSYQRSRHQKASP